MIDVEQISMKLSTSLGNRLNKSNEEIEVLNYGLFTLIHTTIAMISTLLLGVMIGKVKEVVLISLSTALLKKYSGGVHASSPIRCLAIGLLVSFIAVNITTYLAIIYTPEVLFITTIIISILSYYIIYKRAPVGSKNKPLKNESIRKKLRKNSIKVMNLYTVILLIMNIMCMNTDNYQYKTYTICIVTGILIQVFSMTCIGEYVIHKLDILLSKYF